MIKKHFWEGLIIFLVFTGLIWADPFKVSAQGDTTLAVLPAEAELELAVGESVTLDLWVTNAVDLNAFDITVTYDPAVAQLDAWAHGGMLNISWEPVIDNQPGSFRLAGVQLAQPAVSGDGSLLKLTFSGVASGSSAVPITAAVFSDPAGAKTYPTRLPGQLEVFPTRFTVSGSVSLQGQTLGGGVPVTLGVGQTLQYGPYETQSLYQEGQNLFLNTVVKDTYQITTHQPRYLNVHSGMNILMTVEGDKVLPDLSLKGGNAVWTDNVIDISDASVVGSWYGKTTDDLVEGEVFDADVNFDGVVNVQDLALVAGNFDLNSETAYDGWQP